MSNAYSTTEKVLSEHLPQLEVVAGELMEKEKLDGEAFRALMRGVSLPAPKGTIPSSPLKSPEHPSRLSRLNLPKDRSRPKKHNFKP